MAVWSKPGNNPFSAKMPVFNDYFGQKPLSNPYGSCHFGQNAQSHEDWIGFLDRKTRKSAVFRVFPGFWGFQKVAKIVYLGR